LRFVLSIDLVEEELMVCDHPVAITDKQHRSELENTDSVLCELIVHGRWKFVKVCEIELFEPPNIEV
jgi:hypothetical protein